MSTRYYIKVNPKGYSLFVLGGRYGYTLIWFAEFDWAPFIEFSRELYPSRIRQEASTFG